MAALVALIVGPWLLGNTDKGPAAAPSSAQAGKWCAGKKIVFFPGGPAGGVFAVNVYNGAKQAAKDLGVNVQYEWSNWDPATMVSQFKSAIATKPTGIAVMGHPGDAAIDKWIDQAETKGIIVTSQNTPLPKAEAKYAAKGFGYVGQNLYNSGLLLGQSAVSQLHLKKGDRAMVWGLLSAADARAAHEGRDRRSEEGGPEGRLHRDQHGDERRPDRGHAGLHRLRDVAS